MSGLYECRPWGSCPVCNAPEEEKKVCPDCGYDPCCCDEMYEAHKDRMRGV